MSFSQDCEIFVIFQDTQECLRPDDFTGNHTEFQLKWIEALESGNYQQGNLQLRLQVDDKMFNCCLGVACEVFSAPFTPKPENYDDLNSSEQADINYGYCFPNGLYSNEIFEDYRLLNLKTRVGGFNPEGYREHIHYGIKILHSWCYSLTELNDLARFTFQDIAYLLRHYPQIVFTNFAPKTSAFVPSSTDLLVGSNGYIPRTHQNPNS